MLGRLILRVGLLTLVFSTTLLSETIPFDYWYGRIVGAHHFSTEYTDAKFGLSRYALSYSGGYRDKFQIGFPDLLLWTPNATGDKSDWTNPTFNGALRLSNSTRYVLDRADIRVDSFSADGPGWSNQNRNDSYEWDQSVIHLDNGGVEYTPAKAAYLYLHGIWLAPRQTYVKMEADFKIGRQKLRAESSGLDGEESRSWRESRQRAAGARVELGTGLSRMTNFNVITSLTHSSTPEQISGMSSSLEYDPLDLPFTDFLNYHDQRETRVNIVPSVVWMLSAKHWIETGLGAEFYWSDYEYYSKRRELRSAMDSTVSLQLDTYAQGVVKLYLVTNWLSKTQVIESERILDNFQDYYGKQLSKNTLRVVAALTYSVARDEDTQLHQYLDDPPFNSESRSGRQLAIDLAPDFSLSQSIVIGGQAHFLKRTYVDWHSQRLASSLYVAYLSYRWNPERRRDLSWNGIRNIDYLLGAMLRPSDLRLSVAIDFPQGVTGGQHADASFWKLYQLRFDDEWRLRANSALGVLSGVEFGLDLELWSYYSDRLDFRQTRWYLTPQVRVQPLRWLRITSKSENEYHHPYDDFFGHAIDEFRRSWKFDLRVDCVF